MKGQHIKFDPDYPLSETWRVRKSVIPEVELRYITEAIAALVQGAASEQVSVSWHGTRNDPGSYRADKSQISLSYAPLMDETTGDMPNAPVDPNLVDVVAGVGIHEQGHIPLKGIRKALVSERKLGYAEREVGQTNWDRPKRDDEDLCNILEDVFIDYQMVDKKPVLGAYIRRGREWHASRSVNLPDRMADDATFTRKELQGLAGMLLLYDVDVLEALKDRTADDVSHIMDYLSTMTKTGIQAASSMRDPRQYERLVNSAWKAASVYLEEHPEPPEPPQDLQPDPDAEPEDEDPEHEDGSPSEQGAPSDGDEESKEEDDNEGKGQQGGEDDEGEEEEDEEQGGNGGEQDEEPDEDDKEEDTDEGETGSGNEKEEDEQEEEEDDGDGDEEPQQEPQEEPEEDGGEAEVPPPSVDRIDIPSCPSANPVPMPAHLADVLNEAIELDVEDVSEQAEFPGFKMERPRQGRDIYVSPDMTQKILSAFEQRQHMAITRYPFQESGRVCGRTLPRLFLGKTDLFEEIDDEDYLDLSLGVAVDASSSISQPEWQIIEQSCQGLVGSFMYHDGVDLFIMSYSGEHFDEDSEGGTIHRLFEPGFETLRHERVGPGGSTPTVPAIKVLADRMTKKSQRRERMIISLTDGAPNAGGSTDRMRETVTRLTNGGFFVLGIGVTSNIAGSQYHVSTDMMVELMSSQYDHWKVIEGFEQLPDVLAEIIGGLM